MENIDFSSFRNPDRIKVNVGRKLFSKIKKKGRAFGQNFKNSSAGEIALGTTDTYNSALGHIDTGFVIANLVQNIKMGNVGEVADLAGTAGKVSKAVGYVGFGLGAALDLITFVSDKYSNRDGAHEKLQDYVWSLIDDARPSKPLNKEAAAAAMYLIKEGESQQAIGADKLKKAEGPFLEWARDYVRMTKPFHNKNLTFELIALNKKRLKHLEEGFKKGGVVMKYMRRLNHWGDYIQAWEICSLNIQGQSVLTDTLGKDAKYTREYLKSLSDLILQHDKIFEDFATKLQAGRNNLKQASKNVNAGQQRGMMGRHRGNAPGGPQQRRGMGPNPNTFKPPGHR